MITRMADEFTRALREAEEQQNPAPLLPLFAEDSELTNLGREQPCRGQEGAREFWSDYLGFFDEIHSRFNSVVESDNIVVLEWVSDGRLKTGKTVSYEGVSIMEVRGDTVHRFRTYYDSAAFRQAA